MNDREERDFFTDPSLVQDPYPYFEHLREQCPVLLEPHHGVIAVTGYDEAVEVYRDADTFSSCNSVTGPFPPLPFQPEGDDISALIEQFRDRMPMGSLLVTQDGAAHEAQRALLRRLLTPKRLKDNEAFMWRLADHQIDEFIDTGTFEVIRDFAEPFAMLVIADLLGVPEEDHRDFRAQLGKNKPAQVGGDTGQPGGHDPLSFLNDVFTAYITDRRRAPRQDVLTDLATATYLDGSTPDVAVVVGLATFLFAAGQDTTARLIGTAMRVVCQDEALQRLLREDHGRIPDVIEEILRIEGPVKADFRLARRSTMLGGVDIPAGTTVMVVNGAVNRDPRQFEAPDEFRLDRPNYRAHLAFGRGAHACPGGPLSRIEARVALNRLLQRTSDLRISEIAHGPAQARHFDYEPTYILRGLNTLHLDFTRAG